MRYGLSEGDFSPLAENTFTDGPTFYALKMFIIYLSVVPVIILEKFYLELLNLFKFLNFFLALSLSL